MKHRRLEKRDKRNVLLGAIDDHNVMENMADVQTLLSLPSTNARALTIGMINSGYSVAMQRGLVANMSDDQRRDAIALDAGFTSWDEMITFAKRAKLA